MKSFVTVLRRELSERWLIAVAAALLGLVPLAVPFLPLGSSRAPDARSGTAVALALIVSYVLALVLGSSVLARDLAERRLGFYFSRPLPGWAIWAGKMAAAALLAFGSGLLVLLPSVLLGDRPDPSGYWANWGGNWGQWRQGFAWNDPDPGMLLWAGSVLALLLAANAAGVMVRSRSPWLLLDLLAVTVVAFLVWIFGMRLLSASALGALISALLGLLAASILSCAVASAAQVTQARTDPRRGHRVLSLTLWTLMGLSVLGFGGYAQWVLSASPEDLVEIAVVSPAPAGDWIAIMGTTGEGRAKFEPAFLMDTSSGRFFRLEAQAAAWGQPAFSRDGRRAVWLQASGFRFFPLTMHRLDLRPGAVPAATTISSLSDIPHSLVLSPDGSRLAYVDGDRILAQELRNGRLLLSAEVRTGEVWTQERLRFLDSRTLRFFATRIEGERSEIRVLDFDLDTGRTAREIQVPVQDHQLWAISEDAHRLLLKVRSADLNRSDVALLDLRTEQPPVPIPLPGYLSGASFLHDGRVALVSKRSGRIELLVLNARGGELLRLHLPGAHVRLGGRPSPGHLVVATSASSQIGQGLSRWRSELLDLERGTRRLIGEELYPVGWPGLPEGSIGTELFLGEKGGLVRIDPATGRKRVILRPES
ncbi:MAG TPA: hypothetical protein VN493_28640 [Thermoanaerobaculia bacterium]|nr:hypothetical protein [Thermoanaerobaculia bacterium]